MRKSTHLLKMTTVRKNENDLRKEEAKEEAKRYLVIVSDSQVQGCFLLFERISTDHGLW